MRYPHLLAPIGAAVALAVVPAASAQTETQLTSSGTDQRPAWSPDGSTILFDADRNGNLDIWSVPAGGGTVTQITLANDEDRDAAWSPDGSAIVFASDAASVFDLFTRPFSGGAPVALTSDPSNPDVFPSWSPDSTQIAFAKGGDIYVIPAAGGVAVQVTTDPASDRHPSWSPDGTQLVFQSDRSGNEDVWIIPAAGGVATQLTMDPGTDGAPDWSPDGTHIAFQSDRSGNNDIWAIPAAGGTAVPITTDPGSDVQPDWAPASDRVTFSRDGGIWTASVGADLGLTKTVDLGVPMEADSVVYSIVVTNHGPGFAGGIAVTDLLPAGVSYLSSSATQGSYSPGGGLWSLGSLAVGASDTLTVTVLVEAGTSGQSITNTAAIAASGQPDPVPANDSAAVGITVFNLIPTTETQITGNGTDNRPAWSRDGTRIAFDSNRSGNRDVYTVPVAGGGVTQLTFSGSVQRDPEWSPDGLQLVLSADQPGADVDLFFQSVSGGPLVLLDADPSANDGFPSWSPDSTQIAYRKGDDIYVIPAAGGVPVQVTMDPAVDSHPSWSPDGTQIVFQSNRSGNDDLWIIPASGGVATQLTTDPALDGSPDWSPDGSLIAFHSDRSGNLDIWLVPPTGGALVQATTDPASDVSPDWAPSSNEVVFSRPGTGLWIATFPFSDIAVTKTADDATPDEGQLVTYTVAATNLGPDDATGVGLTDLLPAGVTFVSHTASQGTYNAVSGLWSLGSQLVGEVDTLSLSALVDPGTAGLTLTNVATRTAIVGGDGNPSNDADSAAVTVTAVDLAVAKTVDNPTPNVGASIVYTVIVSNGGPDAATSVTVNDLLPAGVAYTADAASQGTYAPGTGVWLVGSLAAGAADTLMITATVQAPSGAATITNTAAASGADQADPNSANDSSSVDIVIPSVDLAVTKAVDNASPDEGDPVLFSIVVQNVGSTDASGVEVTDLLPAGLAFDSSTVTQGVYDVGSGLWAVGTLVAGAADTLDIAACISAGTLGTSLVNTASLTALDQADTNAVNNTATAVVSVSTAIAFTEVQLTTTTVEEDLRPAWSPDGTTLIFDSNRMMNLDLWSVPATGGAPTQVTFSVQTDRHPAWSPDGTTIVFSSDPGGTGTTDLWTRPAAGGPAALLDSDPANTDAFPAYSPDGTMIAYRKGGDVYVIPSAGGTPVALTTDPGTDSHPSWSPDGMEIVFQSTRSGNTDLWIIPAGGGPAVQLTTDPGEDGAPEWSPDGSRIVFQSDRNGNDDLWWIDPQGGSPVQVTTDPLDDVTPTWSPDGTQIAFARNNALWILSLPVSDLGLVNSVDDPAPVEGQTVTYTLSVTNGGPDAATGVVVNDLLPAGVTLQSATPTRGTYLPGTGEWAVGAIGVSGTETLLLTATVDAGTAGNTITSTAWVVGAVQADPIPGNDSASADVVVSSGAVDAPSVQMAPASFQFLPVRPNPFRSRAVLQFELPAASEVDVSVYDVSGRLVRTVLHERLDAGRYEPAWDGRDLRGNRVSPGVYFVRLSTGTDRAVRKAVRLD